MTFWEKVCTVWRLCHISTRQQMSYFTQSSSTGVMITKTTTAPPKHNNNSLIRLVDFKIDLCRTGWICHRNWIRQNTRITYLSYRDKMKNSTSKQEKKSIIVMRRDIRWFGKNWLWVLLFFLLILLLLLLVCSAVYDGNRLTLNETQYKLEQPKKHRKELNENKPTTTPDKLYVLKCDPHHHRILRSYTIYQQIANNHIENETSKNKIK